MNIYELQAKRRTHRKFIDKAVDYELLKKMVDYARLTASSMNLQPILYKIVTDDKIVDKIFPHVRWAGYLKGAYNPTFEERPRAYILQLYDESIRKSPRIDVGAASYSIQLMAEYEGLGTCWMGAISRDDIMDICNIDKDKYKLDTVLAIGYPKDNPAVVDAADGNIEYYINDDGELSVPKRILDDILI